MADYIRERMGDTYINNAGLIRWIDGEEAANLPNWYCEFALDNDDYQFTTIEKHG